MAERRGRRVIFFSPAKLSVESRGRDTTLTPGISCSISGFMVRGADQQRLGPAAHVEQAIGEDVAAVAVGGELDLVDGHERRLEVARHRLHGRHPEAGAGRLDLLLAGDERDRLRADPVDDALVDLARQQAQRQADQPGVVADHAFDGEVGLAGVGGPEDGCDAAGANRSGERTRQMRNLTLRGVDARAPDATPGGQVVSRRDEPDARLSRCERAANE